MHSLYELNQVFLDFGGFSGVRNTVETCLKVVLRPKMKSAPQTILRKYPWNSLKVY